MDEKSSIQRDVSAIWGHEVDSRHGFGLIGSGSLRRRICLANDSAISRGGDIVRDFVGRIRRRRMLTAGHI